MRVVRGDHFWQFASLATETTDGEIFWPKHGLRSDLRVTNLKIFLEEHALSLFTLKRMEWPYQY